MDKKPDSVDRYVGAILRLVRKAREMSQEKLAPKIGTTFQQVQKYESGKNRVSASRLYRTALVLDVPVSTFFPPESMQPEDMEYIAKCLNDPEVINFNRAIAGIENPDLRQHIIGLVHSIAASDQSG